MYISLTPKIIFIQTEKASREHKRLLILLIIWNHEVGNMNLASETVSWRKGGHLLSLSVHTRAKTWRFVYKRAAAGISWRSPRDMEQLYQVAKLCDGKHLRYKAAQTFCGHKQHVSVILSVCLSIRALSTYPTGPNQLFNSYFKHGKPDNVRSVTDTKTALLFTSSHHHRNNHPSLSSTPYRIIIITVVTTPVTTSLTYQYHHYSHSRFTMIITIIILSSNSWPEIKKTKYEHKTLNSSYRARHIKSILPQIQNYKWPGMCVYDGTTDHRSHNMGMWEIANRKREFYVHGTVHP